MNMRVTLALLVTMSSVTLAAAQPKISPGDMAGRERERFIDSPAERFMKPGPYIEPPLVQVEPQFPPKHRSKRSQRRKRL